MLCYYISVEVVANAYWSPVTENRSEAAWSLRGCGQGGLGGTDPKGARGIFGVIEMFLILFVVVVSPV